MRIATREQIQPLSLDDWGEVLSGEEMRDLRRWQWALLYEHEEELGFQTAGQVIADSHVAIQLLVPQGNFLSFCIHERPEDPGTPRMLTRHEKFHGTAWSRMLAVSGISSDSQAVLDGVVAIFKTRDPRVVNPLRLFEHGMTSTNPYIRILLWVTALDGILMAVKRDIFVERLGNLLGRDSLVFPSHETQYISRRIRVRDVAEDLFVLRSELAHGSPIGRRFWQVNSNLSELLPPDVYGDQPRYMHLLEEASLALLCRTVQTITAKGLIDDYKVPSRWKALLRHGSNFQAS